MSNVMLDADGNAKIIDFGTSYRFQQFGGEVEQRWGESALRGTIRGR